jgi:hypothetical protein
MKEMIAVILIVITKGCWNGMLIPGMKAMTSTRNYSKESLENLSSYGRKNMQIMSILRK